MRVAFLLLSTLAFSCQYFQPKTEEPEVLLAKVGEEVLSFEDVRELIPANANSNDSIVFIKKFADDWIKKQLMIGKAKEAIDFNEAEIQQKVLEYQFALMVHGFEKRFIDQNIDTNVSEQEIIKYYEEKSENFVLRENLVKCMYFKIPLAAPNNYRFRRFLNNYQTDSTDLEEYANQHAVKAFMDKNSWVRFDEVLMETPLKEISDRRRFLQTNNSIETTDEEFRYYLKIIEYKLIGEEAPIEFVVENIRDIIINKRKIELKRELELKIYEEAKSTNAFEILPGLVSFYY